MTNSITERVRTLRKDTLEIAEDSLDHDIRVYQGLSDVAVRLTDLIQQSEVTESLALVNQPGSIPPETPMTTRAERVGYESGPASQLTHSSRTIPIYARYGGVTYQAQLDTSRISGGGRGKCVYFEDQWMTTSGAAGRVTSNAVNGWLNFWRYNRDNGSEAPIAEIRDRQLRSD